jgi:hypothetical protein
MNREEKLKDILEHPDKHFHSFDDLTACCMDQGALDLALMDVHPKIIGSGGSGGSTCDVTEGPCACGAWH